MPFGFSTYPDSREKYLQDIGNILKDKETLVFLDTNILGYLFKLLTAARSEFYDWADELISEERLKIPAWVLSEYHAKFKSNKLSDYTAKSNEPDEIKRKLENLHSIASLIADSSSLKKIQFEGDRNTFLDEFSASIQALTKYTKIFKQQFNTATIHDEIAFRLSKAVLNSDVASLCVRAGAEGEIRASHRMPPGFKDGTKSENKNGDLIIWLEILDYLKDKIGTFKQVVFLSNDEKPDWVYSPTNRMININGTFKSVPNSSPKISLPDPRLVTEFHSTCGTRDFHIITLPIFVEALSSIGWSGILNLASAIQVEAAAIPAEPEELAQPVEPAQPEEPNLLAEPVQLEKPAQTTDLAQPEEPTQNTELAQPEESAQNTGLAQPEESAQNPELAQTEESAQNTGLAQTEESAQNTELAQTEESAQNTGLAQTEESAQNTELAQPEEPTQLHQTPSLPSDLTQPESSAETINHEFNEYPAEALRDSAYEVKEESAIDSIIQGLSSHNWYVQNPAIVAIKNLRQHPFDKAAWFVLGRNIYQAACGNALKAMEFIRNIDIELSKHANDAANHILAGMIFEVYFNRDGELRTEPKSDKINHPFKLIATPAFESARSFLHRTLAPHATHFLVLPGNTQTINLTISVQPKEGPDADTKELILQSVKIEEYELIEDIQHTDDTYQYLRWASVSARKWSIGSITTAVCEHWVIPEWQIKVAFTQEISEKTQMKAAANKMLNPTNQLFPESQ